MRPADLPLPEHYAHGTRARYVSGCRCDACRAANTAAYHERQARARELAAEVTRTIGPIPQQWTAPDGTVKERLYARACPGPGGGVWCVANGGRGAHLRKDSKGGVCRACREILVWNGDVDAAPVRAHLRKLSRQGVGYKSVAEACDVAASVLAAVLRGEKHAVRKRTADRVLAVTRDAAADHACIDACPTWKLILEMRLEAGLTRGEIAQRLGRETPALQLRKGRVLARTALEVRRLHAEVMRELEEERRVGAICPDCGFSHDPGRRRELLLRRLPCTAAEAQEAYPCIYGGPTGSRILYRDLHAAGAERTDGVWTRTPKAPETGCTGASVPASPALSPRSRDRAPACAPGAA